MALREKLKLELSAALNRYSVPDELRADVESIITANVWNNPIHVGVLAIPVKFAVSHGPGYDAVVGISRGIPPAAGKLALLSGYQDAGELVSRTVLREAQEELGDLAFDVISEFLGEPKYVRSFMTASGNVLDFYISAPIEFEVAEAMVSVFEPNAETQAVHLLTAGDLVEDALAFESHTQLIKDLLDGKVKY